MESCRCLAFAWFEAHVLILRIIIYVLASWLIAAHFLRVNELLAVALCLATPLLFLVRQAWSALLLQCLAYVACGIWLLTAWQIVSARWAFGQPWRLSAAILLSVAAISMAAGLLLRGSVVQLRYRTR